MKLQTKISLFLIVISFSLSMISCGEDCKFNAITTDELPAGVLGQPYSHTINYDITCSYTQKTFEIENGNLPEGLELLTDGTVTGNPSETGIFNFTVKARICFASGAYDFTDCHEKTKEIKLVITSE